MNKLKPTELLLFVSVICLFMGKFGEMKIFADFNIYPGSILILFSIFIYLVIKKRNEFKIDIIFITLLLFCFVMMASVFQGNVTSYTINKLHEYLFFVVPLVFLTGQIFVGNRSYLLFFKLVFYLSIALAYIAIITSYINGSIFIGRISALGGGPITFSKILIFGTIAIFVLYFHNYGRKKSIINIFYLINLMIFFISISLSGSRQSFIGFFIVVILFFGFLFLKSTFRLKKRLAILGSTIFGLLILIIISLPKKIIYESIIYRRLALFFESDKGASVNIRNEMINFSFRYFLENPIWGKGIGSFELYTPTDHLYPHNIFAEVGFELGILGVILLIIVMTIPTILFLRFLLFNSGHTDELNKILICALFTCFIYSIYTSQITGDIFDNRWIWFYSLLIVKCIYENNNVRNLKRAE